MATQLGTKKADGIEVNTSEYFKITRIYQDKDTILLVDVQSIDSLIEKLQEAKALIIAATTKDV